jgi:hypothetical protein
MGLFAKFKAGLAKTHAKLTHEIKRIVTLSPKLTGRRWRSWRRRHRVRTSARR